MFIPCIYILNWSCTYTKFKISKWCGTKCADFCRIHWFFDSGRAFKVFDHFRFAFQAPLHTEKDMRCNWKIENRYLRVGNSSKNIENWIWEDSVHDAIASEQVNLYETILYSSCRLFEWHVRFSPIKFLHSFDSLYQPRIMVECSQDLNLEQKKNIHDISFNFCHMHGLNHIVWCMCVNRKFVYKILVRICM